MFHHPKDSGARHRIRKWRMFGLVELLFYTIDRYTDRQGGAAGRAAEWKGDTSDTIRIAYLDKVTLTSCVTTILNSVLQFLHQYFDKAETG